MALSSDPTLAPKPVRLADALSPAERRALVQKSNLWGAWAIASTWLSIAALLAVAVLLPHPLIWLLCVVLLGGRQLALAVLAHEAAHGTLFRSRSLNDGLADWLTARPIWQDVRRYREHHRQHHRHTGTGQDPDLSLHRGLPVSKASLWRKFLRDAFGLTGLKLAFGLLMMDLGYFRYTVAADVQRLPQEGRRPLDRVVDGLRHFGPVVLSNGLIYAALAMAGVGWVYGLWVLAWFTSFPVVLRIRSIAEHGLCPQVPDMLQNTRTTHAGWLARLLVAPMQVNFHREHHLMAAVPCYRLKALNRMLRERGLVPQRDPTYLEVLRSASAAQA